MRNALRVFRENLIVAPAFAREGRGGRHGCDRLPMRVSTAAPFRR